MKNWQKAIGAIVLSGLLLWLYAWSGVWELSEFGTNAFICGSGGVLVGIYVFIFERKKKK